MVAVAGAALALSGPTARAGTTTEAVIAAQPPSPPMRDLEFSGRDFGDLRLEGGVQRGTVAFAALRASVWTEEDGAGLVQRMLLAGDVRVTLGVYEFSAARAVVWLEEIDRTPEGPVHQLAVYFDRVSDPGAEAGISQFGDRLLVSGLVQGAPALRVSSLTRGRPGGDLLVQEGEGRLARFLRELTGAADEAPPTVQTRELQGRGSPIAPGTSQPYEPGTGEAALDAVANVEETLPPAERLAPIFAEEGVLTIAPGAVTLVTGATGEENAVVATGGVVVEYQDRRRGRSLQLTGERAVVFLAPGEVADLMRMNVGAVIGVYVEGDVIATDGRYTLRGPRMYYDVRANRAVVLDGVFWTYDERVRLPLYVRARSVRQEAADQWVAKKVTLANTAFFTPHFSLGSTDVTLTRTDPPGDDPERWRVDADNITLRAGSLPFFYWPTYEGDPGRFPLRSIGTESSSTSGFAIKTAWDVFALTGIERPRGVTADLLVDGYFERGPAFGTDAGWDRPGSEGSLFGYIIPSDNGTDQLSSGIERERDGETRGIILADHREDFDERWSLFLEGSYISDENFVDAFYGDLAKNRREVTNAAYLRRTDGNTLFSALAKGSFNDFTPNQYLLQSQGYQVEKLPEAAYFRLADDVLKGLAPGLVSWSSEYRLSRMGLSFVEPTAADLGYTNSGLSRAALGLEPDESPGDRLRARGFTEESVLRADTRHELSVPLQYGPVTFTPFLVGRATAYDTEFDAYSIDADDQLRLWGAAGLTIATQIQRVDNSVDSILFDLHRTRHLIEPSLTVWHGATNLQQNDLPVYDDRVESIADTSTLRAGVSQVWQTERGGAGRWRSVDVFRLDTHVILATGDSDQESPIGRFFDYRPEYSLLGNYGTIDTAWQVTDAVALSAQEIFDFDLGQSARTSAGGLLQHSDDLSTFAEMRYLNARDVTYVDFGANYRFTRKYTATGRLTYDTDDRDIRFVRAEVRREFPAAILGVSVTFDNISDEVTAAVILEPLGNVPRRTRRLGGAGSVGGGLSFGEQQ